MTRPSILKPEFWSHWGPWMVLAYVIIVVFGLVGYKEHEGTLKRDTVRAADIDRCKEQRPLLLRFRKHVKGVNALANTLVLNSQAVVDATPRGDPQLEVRRTNRDRIEDARDQIAALRGFPVPTVAECERR